MINIKYRFADILDLSWYDYLDRQVDYLGMNDNTIEANSISTALTAESYQALMAASKAFLITLRDVF